MAFAAIFITALALLVSTLPLVLAQDETPPATSLEPIYEAFKAAGRAAPIAVIMGLCTCVLGYLKQTTPTDFKIVNFVYTFLMSLIIGVATIYGGWTYLEITEWLANGCLTLWIYWLAKIIAKKLQWAPIPTGPPATA